MVIDASALIAFLRREPGYDKVAAVLEQQDCFLSTAVLTAEGAWAGLPNLRVSVHLIR